MRIFSRTRFPFLPGALLTVLLGCAVFSAVVAADDASEIKAAVQARYDHGRETLTDLPGRFSEKGAVSFLSSGGLLVDVPVNPKMAEYDTMSVRPKHVEVISLVEGRAAVAMFYAEGSMHTKGQAAVDHYMTRVTEVFVKEGEKWKVRASHYSPITGGSGTSQTSVP